MTAEGVFDEAAFRADIAGKIADASPDVVIHVEGVLDACLSAQNLEGFDVSDIILKFFYRQNYINETIG